MRLTFLFLLIFSLPAFANISIISDLDDTIKITNVKNPFEAVFNGIFTKKVFTGMPEFLGEARTYSNELHILTASPKIIRRSVFRTLRKNNIKFDSVTFKNPFRRESKTNYKIRKITEILEDSMDKFILIGDDVDKDPEVFSKILELYPERILASYIHVIRNREIPSGSIAYWTSADLAIREYLAGRMSQESTEVVLNSLIDVPNLHKVIPDFAHCPRESTIWEWQIQTMFSGKVSLIINRLMEYCNPSKIVAPLISEI